MTGRPPPLWQVYALVLGALAVAVILELLI